MNISLSGKRALVTGAGKGIGRAICKRIAECGAELFALSRTKADLDSLKTEIPKIHTICQDLTEWDRVREEIIKIGPFDLLVNNGGINKYDPFIDTTQKDLDRKIIREFVDQGGFVSRTLNVECRIKNIQINFTEYIICSGFKRTTMLVNFNTNQKSVENKVVTKGMIDKGEGGAIVNISSLNSKKVFKNFSAYGCSKAAVDMLTKCMAVELGKYKICSGFKRTTMLVNFNTNQKSVENKVVTKGMIDKGEGGAIVNISSLNSKKVFENFSAYGCSKAAVDMLTKCMAVELGKYKIRVNAVNPGMVWTPMTIKLVEYIKEKETEVTIPRIPLGGLADTKDVASTVVFLLSDHSKMVTGECFVVDGGHSLC